MLGLENITKLRSYIHPRNHISNDNKFETYVNGSND